MEDLESLIFLSDQIVYPVNLWEQIQNQLILNLLGAISPKASGLTPNTLSSL